MTRDNRSISFPGKIGESPDDWPDYGPADDSQEDHCDKDSGSGRFCTSLRQIANQVPLGFECRSCGASAYNWIAKIDRYAQTGEPCCADFRSWCEKADAAKEAERAEKTANLSAVFTSTYGGPQS